MEEKNIIAIEIGSSKIKGALGSYSPSGVLTVRAVEEEPLLNWVRYGAVSNVEETSHIVNRIIRKIENRVVPQKVDCVYVALGGRSCSSMRRDVDCTLPEEMEITDHILGELRHEAESTPLHDRDLLTVVTREYVVDKTVVERPKGTVGRKIRYSSNLITCRPSSKRNLDILFRDKLNLEVGGYEVRHLAIGDLVLTWDERRLGCMLVDFGAETTAVSVYKNGHLQYLATLPMGSRNITRDIRSLNYLEERAEEIKRKDGNASGNVNTVQHIGGVDYATINSYVSHRAGEIIANIREQVKYAGFRATDLPAGIIMVGRGSRLAGFNDRLSSTTGMKLRVGSITNPDIRISDSRILSTEAVDVISVLYKAALRGAKECLRSDVVELLPEEQYTAPEPVEEPVIEPLSEEPVERPKRKNMWIRGLDAIKNAITNPDDEFEPADPRESLQDDPD